MELAVKQRDAWPITKWPEDLQAAFNSYTMAFWDNPENSESYDCVDNYRCARSDNPAEVAEYEEAVNDGCCGFFDEEIELCGIKVLRGFNYGH